MKKQIFSLALVAGATLFASEQSTPGPMNADWFYGEGPCRKANDLHQVRKWQEAAKAYLDAIQLGPLSAYEEAMARINFAACQMAQRNTSYGWLWFDTANGIPHEQQMKVPVEQLSNSSILVKSDKVGIGDIVHFFKAAGELKKKSGARVIFSVRDFLKGILAHGAQEYDLELVGEKEKQPETDYQTHLLSLLGHCNMHPSALSPEKPFLTAGETEVGNAHQVIDPIVQKGNTVGIVFLGEDRQATFIGGKKMPYGHPDVHGRHISSEAIEALLKKKKGLKLIDCGTKDSPVRVAKELEDRVIRKLDAPFATLVALGMVMNKQNEERPGSVVGIGADQGPTNVFCRSLTNDAQEHMALIISNPEEYEWRMEGEGSVYKQMLSNCKVFKSKSSSIPDQEAVVELAYDTISLDELQEEEIGNMYDELL